MKGKYLIFGQARSGTTTIAACLTRKDGDMIQEPTCIRSGDCYLIKMKLVILILRIICPLILF